MTPMTDSGWTEADQARADLIADIACEVSENEDLVAMVLDAYDARQWRPIESAPKDGTRVMLCRPRAGNDVRIVFGSWDADPYAQKPRPFWSDDQDRIWGRDHQRKMVPTHWQPLPAPPQKGDAHD